MSGINIHSSTEYREEPQTHLARFLPIIFNQLLTIFYQLLTSHPNNNATLKPFQRY
jgi:hypothetical protein